MFRKPNRALRVRKAESSEEEQEEEPGQLLSRGPRKQTGRGLFCGTDREKKSHLTREAESGSEDESCQAEGRVPVRSGAPASLLSFGQEREDEDVSFKIKKPTVNAVVFKVQKRAKNRHCKRNSEKNDNAPKSESDDSSDLSERDTEDYQSECSSSGSHEITSQPSPPKTLSTDCIPGTKLIQAARKQRKLARSQRDFISLDAEHVVSHSSQSESDSDIDDHEKRIKFAPGTKTLKERMAEEMSPCSNLELSNDEDTQGQWEEQQIRKAVGHRKAMDEETVNRFNPLRSKRNNETRFSLPPVSVQDMKKKLVSRLGSVQEVHRSHVAEREKFTHDLESTKNMLEQLETASSEQTYKFFKKMKTYIENFVDCINEKLIHINRLETEMFELIEKRAETLLKRRQDDLRKESVFIQKLSGSKDAENVAPNELIDCELRRGKRRQRRMEAGDPDHCEGMSSDDELPTDDEREFQEHKQNISLQSKTIFEDVNEDFHKIKNILSKFKEWREGYPESYYDAYISLCLPKLLNPLLRVHLLDWNPLEEIKDLEQMDWYQDVKEFCYSRNEGEMNESSSDHKLLLAVIEKSVVPKVSVFIEHFWDPLSSVQIDCLAHFCNTYIREDKSSKAVQGLINCLVSTMKKSIEDDVFIPLYSKSLLEDRSSRHSQFQERQFWSAVKMFRNVLSWDGFLEEETLQDLALDKVFNRYLLLVLLNTQPGTEMVTKCKRVVECLPESWFRSQESGSPLQRLANFSKHLLQCIHTLYKLNDRENMKILVHLLLKIKAMDYAEEVINRYNMEELKGAK